MQAQGLICYEKVCLCILSILHMERFNGKIGLKLSVRNMPAVQHVRYTVLIIHEPCQPVWCIMVPRYGPVHYSNW